MEYWRTLTGIGIAFGVSACASIDQQPAAPQWQSIFDGETLTGWTPKIIGHPLGADPDNIFRVEDGALVVSYDQVETFDNTFGHLFFEIPASDYRLRFEYKFFVEQAAGGPAWAFMNSGVMAHTQAPETMRVDQAFPISVEAQLLGTAEATPGRTTANICTPGTHIVMSGELITEHCINSQTLAAPADTWISFELDVRAGETMRLSIADAPAFLLESPEYDPADPDVAKLGLSGAVTQGYFALQAESHPVAFRNIEWLNRAPID